MAKVAIVEDNPPIAEMYRYKLTLAGFDVRVANDGIEGLKLCKDFLPNIVLVDLRMPRMSGSEMLKEMRSQRWSLNIRVIVLTNVSRTEAPAELQFLGVDRYIIKAHSVPSHIVEVVKDLLLSQHTSGAT